MQKIIHVDNSAFFRKVVKNFLTERGFLIENYSQGGDALDLICCGQVSLVLTGLSFSDMDGEVFIQKALEYVPELPIIAITSTQDQELEERLYDLGIKGRVLKSGAWKEQLIPMLNRFLSY
ncbi:MAG: response regulator [Treponema sp.]|jgi:CheY-like chemotaxis protein|nr:response regulator [Treponema sp.]